MSDFHDVRFPVDIAFASEGGPMRKTEIVTLASGHEERNSPWAGSRRKFNAGYGVKSLEAIADIISFFEARAGRLYSFRWRDPFDWKSCASTKSASALDQTIGLGDGQKTIFRLCKKYQSGDISVQRAITLPVEGTVQIAVDGITLAESDYSVDHLVGEVNFVVPPEEGQEITAGFLFDIPVRFDTDTLSVSLAAFEAGDIPNIPVIEVLR